ncbi:MAG: hypothetical protein JW786_13915 [Desulfobacterales bacterium]|nr:hypothetical protein [Desulfobacterales bacterium]
MPSELNKHPSDIAQSAVKYLRVLKISEKIGRLYAESAFQYLQRIKDLKTTNKTTADVLFLFVEYLRSNPHAVIETQDGKRLLTSNWNAYDGRVISCFIDWWLPLNVIDNSFQIKVPGVLRKWIKWCHRHKYFDENHFKNFISALPKGKSEEIKRLLKAGELLYRLHSPCRSIRHNVKIGKVVSINTKRQPLEIYEGYMKVIRIENQFGFLQTREGGRFGPVLFGKDLVRVIKSGDVLAVEIARYGKCWKVRKSGNVYARGVVF